MWRLVFLVLIASSPAAAYDWTPLKVGAGGWLTGISISSDGGTVAVRTDTYGGYVHDAGGWRQLMTASAMPSDENSFSEIEPTYLGQNPGIFAIAVAPSDAQRIYMAARGAVYRSTDRGLTWTRTAFVRVASMDPNLHPLARTWGERMAVDPTNPDIVFFGSQSDGLWRTANGGSSWTRVSAVGVPTSAVGITGIRFRSSSTLFAAVPGVGVWRSTNAGSTWTRISGSAAGGPVTVQHAAVTNTYYYATEADGSGLPTGKVWRFDGSSWLDISPGGTDWQSIATDPLTAGRVLIGTHGALLRVSRDSGITWDDLIDHSERRRVSNDIAWLASMPDTDHMSNGNLVFDPVVPGKIWLAEGTGVWTAQLAAGPQSTITWNSISLGIEQLVANTVVIPPGGVPVVAQWDRPLFHLSNLSFYPAAPGPTLDFDMGWHVDWASTRPSFLVAFVCFADAPRSSTSSDGGRTWTPFPSFPVGSDCDNLWGWGGTGAASTPSNWVWVSSSRRAPYYTLDAGASWTKIALPGVADDSSPGNPNGWDGIHWAFFLNRHIVTADRVTPGTFYIYHTARGIYRTTNGGATWTNVHAGPIANFSGVNALLKAVPGKAGHLFFTSGSVTGGNGPAANPDDTSFVRSRDGGVTWTAVNGVKEVSAFGFGGGDYPAIVLAGWVNGTYGIWRSTDDAASWTMVGDYPAGSLDTVTTIDGFKDRDGMIVGFRGSGYTLGLPSVAPAAPVAPILIQ